MKKFDVKFMTFLMLAMTIFFIMVVLFDITNQDGIGLSLIMAILAGFATVVWAQEWDKIDAEAKKHKKIFIICPVRNASVTQVFEIGKHIAMLENKGYNVHYPALDTDQTQDGLDICADNSYAINDADEVHIYYDANSRDSHFDLGVTFALNKKLVVINKSRRNSTKSFYNMIMDWENYFINEGQHE